MKMKMGDILATSRLEGPSQPLPCADGPAQPPSEGTLLGAVCLRTHTAAPALTTDPETGSLPKAQLPDLCPEPHFMKRPAQHIRPIFPQKAMHPQMSQSPWSSNKEQAEPQKQVILLHGLFCTPFSA